MHPIDCAIGRFVSDPVGFRQEMKNTGAIIAGALPIQFFANEYWEDSEMHVFVQRGRLPPIPDILEEDGYEEVPPRERGGVVVTTAEYCRVGNV